MRTGFRLIVVLLLLVQGWIGFTRGQSVCIELAPCEAHAAERDCGDHAHGAVPTKDHRHEDCACHAHVAEIDETQAPVPAPTAVPVPAECFVEAVSVVLMFEGATAVRATAPPPRPPAMLVPLRSTRLVV